MKFPSIHERGTYRRTMIDPLFVPRDVDIIVAGFVSAVLILLLGLVLTVPFAGAQTVPFDGRIDELVGNNIGGYPIYGDQSYPYRRYYRIDWIPTSTGIFCGFETRVSGSQPPYTDVSLEGTGITPRSWVELERTGTLDRDLNGYLWPEECFTYTSGTTYSFTFSNHDNASQLQQPLTGSGTSTNYELYQYTDGAGWFRIYGEYPDFAIIGTSDASSTEWYQQNVEPELPVDFSETDWWGGWKNLGTKLFTEKAPFGYVSSIGAIWEDLGTGTTTDFVLNVNGAEVKLMDATTTKEAIGSDNWTLIRGFIEALLWFGFMMYLVTRINQIQV